jgi:hypothetical protein
MESEIMVGRRAEKEAKFRNRDSSARAGENSEERTGKQGIVAGACGSVPAFNYAFIEKRMKEHKAWQDRETLLLAQRAACEIAADLCAFDVRRMMAGVKRFS